MQGLRRNISFNFYKTQMLYCNKLIYEHSTLLDRNEAIRGGLLNSGVFYCLHWACVSHGTFENYMYSWSNTSSAGLCRGSTLNMAKPGPEHLLINCKHI